MKISLEFDSVKEMREFYDGIQFVPYGTIRKEKAQKASENAQKASENAQKVKKAPEKTSAIEEKPEEAETLEELTIIDVRKLLKMVNKKTGKNTAKAWIEEEGFKSLADIKDQEIIQRLYTKAEEVINAE